VISLPAAALGSSTPQKSLTTSNIPESITAVETKVAEARAELALKRGLRGDVLIHQDSQAAVVRKCTFNTSGP
jgi:hypothetical protein